MFSFWRFFSSLCRLFPSLSAQLTTTTISGTLTDITGATVPDAAVSAVETSTGAVARAVANSDGFYVLSGLAPGQYRLRVEKPGFQVHVQEGIVAEVNRPVNVNVTLQVGATTQTLTVTSAAEQVNLRSQTISYEVTRQMVTELPLNGRNILQLMQLAPDTGPVASSSYQQPAARPENTNTYISASGGRGNSTAFYLDGAVNEDALTEVANVFPNPDAMQEFSFATNNYSAKFAGRGGGVMNAVTRGGSEPVPRRPVRVPAQQQFERAQLLCRGPGRPQTEPIRRNDRRDPSATTTRSSFSPIREPVCGRLRPQIPPSHRRRAARGRFFRQQSQHRGSNDGTAISEQAGADVAFRSDRPENPGLGAAGAPGRRRGLLHLAH